MRRRWSGLTVFALVSLLVAPMPLPAEEFPVGDRHTMWADPYLIGSMRQVREIYPTRTVRRAGPVSDLPPGAEDGAPVYVLGRHHYRLEDYFVRARTMAFIALRDGRIEFERYRLGTDGQSELLSMSVAKSIVSTLVGLAIGDGLIASVDDPIDRYLPELAGSGYEGVPIKAVLQMSSGVSFVENYVDPDSDFNRMWRASVQENSTPITEFVRSVGRYRGKPFGHFHYAAVDTLALGWLVSRVTGRSLSEYLAERIWQPLGMEADATWILDGSGETASEVAFCCLSATLRDYARFGLLMARDGVWQGRRLLPEDWVREATRPDGAQVQPGRISMSAPQVGYQYQWWTLAGEDGAFTARGIHGQYLYVNPAAKLVIVLISAWPTLLADDLERHTLAVFAAFARSGAD